jgi:hypothetical protein
LNLTITILKIINHRDQFTRMKTERRVNMHEQKTENFSELVSKQSERQFFNADENPYSKV